MPLEESKHWRKGNRQASYYADDLKRAKEEKERDAAYPKAVKPEEMPWENSPHGRVKHLAREGINPRIKDIDVFKVIASIALTGCWYFGAQALACKITKLKSLRLTGWSNQKRSRSLWPRQKLLLDR